MSSQAPLTAVVTGANSGIGYETVLALAAQGITIVLACRHPGRMSAAAEAIRSRHPTAAIDEVTLDLGSLTSVHAAAEQIATRHPHIDILINNAGIMKTPRWTTHDGYEMQFGVNHLGHYALTMLLLDNILKAPRGRVVTVSSLAHRQAITDIERWPNPRDYHPHRAYAASKLANILFTQELHRRLQHAGHLAMSLACHPGWSNTNLPYAGPRARGHRATEAGLRVLAPILTQSAAKGAMPSVYAATNPDATSGTYVGPTRLGCTRGPAGPARLTTTAADQGLARRLWALSEELTGIAHPALPDIPTWATSTGGAAQAGTATARRSPLS
ncbi:oxidoreductase [Micromonospora haikouensis]|uniref:oxidoreductase n=1 Tax=Micromonospora haikouensis TaxID=686309 RepID=UPI0036D0F72C